MRTVIKDDAASYESGIIYEARITLKGKQKVVTVIDNLNVHSQSHIKKERQNESARWS